MLTEFINKKLKVARYKLLKDGSYFGEISGLEGAWADAKTLENCRQELQEVLKDWLLLKIRSQEKIPGFNIKIDRRELVSRHA
jgi:predicted RNase H-like HicB family nuclease